MDGIGVREALLARLSSPTPAAAIQGAAARRKVSILTSRRATAIERDGVIVSDRPLIGGGKIEKIPARFVVLSLGNRPADDLFQQEENREKFFRIGDCLNPGNAFDAIHQAFEVAVKI